MTLNALYFRELTEKENKELEERRKLLMEKIEQVFKRKPESSLSFLGILNEVNPPVMFSAYSGSLETSSRQVVDDIAVAANRLVKDKKLKRRHIGNTLYWEKI